VNNEISGECSIYGGEEKYIQGFGGETLGKETTWKTQAKWKDNIKMDLEELGYGDMGWIIWLKIGACECV